MASSSIRNWVRSSPLGAGSFANVSLAVNLDDGGLFAVKSTPCCCRSSSIASSNSSSSSTSSSSFSPHSSSSAELLALENEFRILQALDSPSILRCLGGDHSVLDGSPSRNLFLEYMDGGSIADAVRKSGGKLEAHQVRAFTRGILEGLAYLHRSGFVHCDIKGQNILLQSGTGAVKIADFGAAKRMANSSASFKGTPLWMAPEVVRGSEQGPASDIWSLGCTVVEMMQGRPPWSNRGSLAAFLFEIGSSERSVPLPECASEEALDFLRKCFHRDPRLRWTAAQLLYHPFVQLEAAKEQPSSSPPFLRHSPRSTLDFLDSHSISDGEDECVGSDSVPLLSLPISAMAKHCEARCRGDDDGNEARAPIASPVSEPSASQPGQRGSIPASIEEGNCWITVRCSNGWLGDSRHKPFFARSPHAMVVKRACHVDWEPAGFLLARRPCLP